MVQSVKFQQYKDLTGKRFLSLKYLFGADGRYLSRIISKCVSHNTYTVEIRVYISRSTLLQEWIEHNVKTFPPKK